MLPGSPLYGCDTIGLAHSSNLAFNSGLPFADVARQPPYGCGTIGLAHSSNLFGSSRPVAEAAPKKLMTTGKDRVIFRSPTSRHLGTFQSVRKSPLNFSLNE